MNSRHPLYQAALDADDAYTAAIIAAHGPKATRWNLPYPLLDAVNASYEAKRNADWEWLNHMQTARKELP